MIAEAIRGMKNGTSNATAIAAAEAAAAKQKAKRDKIDRSKDEAGWKKENTKLKQLVQKVVDEKAKALPGGGAAGLKTIIQRLRNLNERVIGKAYSFARPGDRLEVGLQPRSEF